MFYRVIDFSWRSCVLHKSRDTQKSMDCKQTKNKIGDLYVNIKVELTVNVPDIDFNENQIHRKKYTIFF